MLTYLYGKVAHLLEPAEETREVFENWEPWMEALEQGVRPPDPSPGSGDGEVWQEDDGAWRTCFPPPDGFDGYEEGKWDGLSWYCRSLTAREQAALDSDTAAERAQECDRRDRFVGFAGNEISPTREAEPYEASETSGPIEYKSLTSPSVRRKPEPVLTAKTHPPVIPAKAGTSARPAEISRPGVPIFAGMTIRGPEAMPAAPRSPNLSPAPRIP